jgi:hypothetical protein
MLGGGLFLRHGSFILASFDRPREKGYGVAGVAHARQRIARTYPRRYNQRRRIDLVTLGQEVGGPALPHGATESILKAVGE